MNPLQHFSKYRTLLSLRLPTPRHRLLHEPKWKHPSHWLFLVWIPLSICYRSRTSHTLFRAVYRRPTPLHRLGRYCILSLLCPHASCLSALPYRQRPCTTWYRMCPWAWRHHSQTHCSPYCNRQGAVSHQAGTISLPMHSLSPSVVVASVLQVVALRLLETFDSLADCMSESLYRER